MILATLTNPKESGASNRVFFFPAPETFPAEKSMSERSWELIEGGTVTLPKGVQPTGFTVSGWFPGGADVGQAYAPVGIWRPPKDLIYTLRTWMEGRAIVDYLATETDLAASVYLKSLKWTWGERDRLHFEIELVEARTLTVDVLAAAETVTAAASDAQPAALPTSLPNGQPIPATYMVRPGDTLSTIAANLYGSPDLWYVIWFKNEEAVGGPIQDSNVLEPGWVLTIPNGTPGIDG